MNPILLIYAEKLLPCDDVILGPPDRGTASRPKRPRELRILLETLHQQRKSLFFGQSTALSQNLVHQFDFIATRNISDRQSSHMSAENRADRTAVDVVRSRVSAPAGLSHIKQESSTLFQGRKKTATETPDDG